MITRTRKQCATDNGYRIHLKRGEQACQACLVAHREEWHRYRASKGMTRTELKPCGTRAAYKRHLRRREVPCWRCTLANRHGQDFVEETEMAA